MSTPKPYEISKRIVWEAWQNVKRKRGSYGMDKESIEDIEKDLKRHPLWSLRMEKSRIEVKEHLKCAAGEQ